MELLTIVIPCFNSEKYLKRLFDSLNNQTDLEYELIIIDDCSADSTIQLISQYPFNPKIKLNIIKNEKNCGPGESRNKCIDKAKGKYITFVDSDDYIDHKYVETFKKQVALSEDIDCIVVDFFKKNGQKLYKNSMYIGKKRPKDPICQLPTEDAMVYVRGGAWGKFYRTEMIKKEQIKFLPLFRGEDIPFTKTAIAFSKKIIYIQKPMYYYVVHEESLMHDETRFSVDDTKRRIEYIKRKVGSKYQDEVEALFALHCLYSIALNTAKRNIGSKKIKYIVDELIREYPYWHRNTYLKGYPMKYQIAFKIIKSKCIFLFKIIARWI